MKKLFILVTLCSLILAANCWAVNFKPNLSIKTGDEALDLHLKNVNEKSANPFGAIIIKNDLKEDLSLTDREMNFLSQRGYSLAEINYLALLAKQSGKSVNDVAALHSKGVGWGVLAKRLGVKPRDLNKLRVKQKKQEKVKEEKREHLKLKINNTEPEKIKWNLKKQGNYGNWGKGKGKGK